MIKGVQLSKWRPSDSCPYYLFETKHTFKINLLLLAWCGSGGWLSVEKDNRIFSQVHKESISTTCYSRQHDAASNMFSSLKTEGKVRSETWLKSDKPWDTLRRLRENLVTGKVYFNYLDF